MVSAVTATSQAILTHTPLYRDRRRTAAAKAAAARRETTTVSMKTSRPQRTVTLSWIPRAKGIVTKMTSDHAATVNQETHSFSRGG